MWHHRFTASAVLFTATVLALPFAPSPAQASTLRAASLHDLVARAELVVFAQAVARRSYWSEGRILTRITFNIDETWVDKTASAKMPQSLDVVTLGGAVDNIGQRVDGAMRSELGERAVLCLKHNGIDAYNVVGMAQGAFFVQDDTLTSTERSLRTELADARRMAVTRRLADVELVPNHAATRDVALVIPTTLGTLKDAILEAARAR